MQSYPRNFNYVVADFEFRPKGGVEGNAIEVICGVFKDVTTGRQKRLWADELTDLSAIPFFNQPSVVLVAYYASAEISCLRALGWRRDIDVLDLYAECRVLTNGFDLPKGRSLLGVMDFFGLPAIESVHKERMRDLALRGGPFSAQEKLDLLDYCADDVAMTEHLLHALAPKIDLPRALLRGKFSHAIAEMEAHGSPIDRDTFLKLEKYWGVIRHDLIQVVDQEYGVYQDGTFREDYFEGYLRRRALTWPRHPSGRPKLDDATFKEMSKVSPEIKRLRTLRETLAKFRFSGIRVGEDGRNRCLLSPFGASTGRNTPSSTGFIFGWPKWFRGLIQPKPGFALAYLDYSQQEFGIAAALSGDKNMIAAYRTGDPYMAFAIQAGAAPVGATKDDYPLTRKQFKDCVLAVQYGMGADSLALQIDQPVLRARQLLTQHRRVYKTFWDWSDDMFNRAIAQNESRTVYGWRIRHKPDLNPRSVRNFPMQATAAEILRLTCILVYERGVQLCAPVHDAILIEAPEALIEEHAQIAKDCMAKASEIVLYGFTLASDSLVIEHPKRFLDKESTPFWEQIMSLLAKAESSNHGDSYTHVLEIPTPVHSYISY